jgi:hypothetical protein
MSPGPSTRFDWHGWSADVVERLDRRSIGIGVAWVVVTMVFTLMAPVTDRPVGSTLFRLGIVMATLVVLAVALVAVARGISAWVAYPLAGFAAIAIGSLVGIVFDPFRWLAATPPPPLHAVIRAHLFFLSFLIPPAVLYVYASSAAHNAKVLRAVEAERAAETERLARQRLQTELATVDHDLVLRAMRLALAVPAHEAAQAESLLEAVTAYLRVAQQRDASDPGRIAAALAELRQACASRGGEPAPHVLA